MNKWTARKHQYTLKLVCYVICVVCIVFLQGGDSYMCIFVDRKIICNHGWILSVFTIGWKLFQ